MATGFKDRKGVAGTLRNALAILEGVTDLPPTKELRVLLERVFSGRGLCQASEETPRASRVSCLHLDQNFDPGCTALLLTPIIGGRACELTTLQMLSNLKKIKTNRVSSQGYLLEGVS